MHLFARRRKRSGLALILILMALAVLGAVAAGMVTAGSGHLMQAYSSSESVEAEYAARAGAYMKLAQLRSGNLDPLKSTELTSTGAFYSATVTAGPGPGNPAFPPDGTYYVEGVGRSRGGKERRLGILASLSNSRWDHAIFGNNKITLKSGSYTDSFDSDNPLATADHSKASIATNNPTQGIEIEDNDGVVIGWANSRDAGGAFRKGKSKGEVEIHPMANVVGPPGSLEGVTVKADEKGGRKGKGQRGGKSYKDFSNASQEANMDPVEIPAGLPAGTAGTVNPSVSPLPSVVSSPLPTRVPPGAYHDLRVTPGQVALLDVSTLEPGSTAEYVFHSIELRGGTLQVLQPPTGDPVTVKLYVDTGSGNRVDTTAGIRMEGGAMVNPVSKPINLQFLVAGQGKLTLEGHDERFSGATPTAYWVAYAPEAKIELNKGQIYGAIVANEVVLDGDSLTDASKPPAVVHYDVTLLDDDENPAKFRILSVRRY